MSNKDLDAQWLKLLGLREDGRRMREHRTVDVNVGCARSVHVDGSCELRMGLTQVTAHVIGPREAPRRSDEAHDMGSLEVNVTVAPSAPIGARSQGSRERAGRELAGNVKRALSGALMLERYPRSQIAIELHVSVDDGGVLSCCCNAASVALVDAGIFLNDVTASCSVAFYLGQLVVDPTRNETRQTSSLDVTVLPSFGTVTFFKINGEALPFDDIEKLLEAAVAAASSVGERLADDMRDHVADKVDVLDQSAAATRAEGAQL